jgi:hypothetical protein
VELLWQQQPLTVELLWLQQPLMAELLKEENHPTIGQPLTNCDGSTQAVVVMIIHTILCTFTKS